MRNACVYVCLCVCLCVFMCVYVSMCACMPVSSRFFFFFEFLIVAFMHPLACLFAFVLFLLFSFPLSPLVLHTRGLPRYRTLRVISFCAKIILCWFLFTAAGFNRVLCRIHPFIKNKMRRGKRFGKKEKPKEEQEERREKREGASGREEEKNNNNKNHKNKNKKKQEEQEGEGEEHTHSHTSMAWCYARVCYFPALLLGQQRLPRINSHGHVEQALWFAATLMPATSTTQSNLHQGCSSRKA